MKAITAMVKVVPKNNTKIFPKNMLLLVDASLD
jgi:hypothetical protein